PTLATAPVPGLLLSPFFVVLLQFHSSILTFPFFCRKIFIGGLAKETTLETFVNYFEKYGEITDSVIMKDRQTGRPRGFGFITYADPSVVDQVIQENHIISGKQVLFFSSLFSCVLGQETHGFDPFLAYYSSQVEIKRTIPKGSSQANDFKTKKIFVGGIPTSVSEGPILVHIILIVITSFIHYPCLCCFR
ncbi:hypothetical protein V8G54_032427, partial [Vigna mungo]